MVIDLRRDKLINAIIYFVKNTKRCGLTKLLKLLYFLDFIHFRETGKSVTGNKYYAWKRGPVATDLWYEIKDNPGEDFKNLITIVHPTEDQWQTEFHPRKKFNKKIFTKRELRIMEELVFLFKNTNATEMSEITHLKGTPWEKTCREKSEFSEIDYMLSLDGSDERQLPEEEIKARIEEIEETKGALG